MNIEFLQTIITLLIGAGITYLTTYMNNRNLLKRDDKKYKHELSIEKNKIEQELNQKYRLELLNDLEKLNLIVGKLDNSISLTSSVIESTHKISAKEFDNKYLEEVCDIIQLECLGVSKFTDMHDLISSISELHNQFWGNQRLLLMSDVNEDKEVYTKLHMELIEISNKTHSLTQEIKKESIGIARKIKNKYVA